MTNGADNFHKSDRVTVQKVAFKTQYRTTVTGNLILPKTLKARASYPALVVGHPMGAVKEQSATLYATKMAEQGFVAMSMPASVLTTPFLDLEPRSEVAENWPLVRPYTPLFSTM